MEPSTGTAGAIRLTAVPWKLPPVPQVPNHLLMDGQSLALTPAGTRAFDRLVTLLDPAWWPTNYVAAVSGTYYFERKNGGTYSAATRVDPHLSGTYRNVIVDIAGQSDLFNGGSTNLTAAQLLTAVESYITERKTADPSLLYIVCTVPATTVITGGQETQRLAYNALLTSGTYTAGKINGVADIASVPELLNPNDTTYFSDGLHWTGAGADAGMAKVKLDLANRGFIV